MSSKVWTFFKKLGHYAAVGFEDVDKFVQVARQSGILATIPGGNLINAGFGVFEKLFMGVKDTETTFAAIGQQSNGPAKLLAATPKAAQALLDFADGIGMKISNANAAKLQTISSGYASLTADFWNILEPKDGDKLPTPPTPATPAPAPTVAK